jgi:hypothetical protein
MCIGSFFLDWLAVAASSKDRYFAEEKARLALDRRSEPRDVLVVDVHDRSALLAHQMVMGYLLLHLEEATGRTEMGLSYQAETHQELQSPIDRGQIHMGERLLDPGTYLLGAQMAFLAAKHIPYQRALGSKPVALLLERAGSVVCHA